MTTPKEVKKLVERIRGPVRSVLDVASAPDRIDRAPGQRPRGVLVCGEQGTEPRIELKGYLQEIRK